MFYLYGKKIGKIGYYCQFSIGDAFVLNSSRLLYRHKKMHPKIGDNFRVQRYG